MNSIVSISSSTISLENRLASWAKGPGKVEAEKCERAVTAIKKAIEYDSALSERGVSVFAQGSYQNRTNVRADSDVDVCVRCDDVFFPQYPDGTTRATFGNNEADYINKALIEIPPKFAGKPPVNPELRKKLSASGSWKGAAGLAEDIRYYGQWMRGLCAKAMMIF